MEVPVDGLRASVVYQHLIRIIVPRPIAWVSTVSASGTTNLAPFSFFTGVGSRPPSLLFCPANRRDGSPKDTLRNIGEVGDFVVNIVSESLAESMNATSAELPEDESEFDVFGIAAAASVVVRPPRVAEAPVSLECQVMQVLALDDGPGAANIVIGRIVHMHIADRVLDPAGFVAPGLLDAVGRLGGSAYCRTRDAFEMPRPE